MVPILGDKRNRIFAWLLVATLSEIATAAILAWCVHHLFDELAGRHHHPLSTNTLIAASLTAAVLLLVLQVGQRRLTEGMGLSYASDARLALFEHMLRMPPRAVLSKKPGILLLPFVGDLTALRQWVSDGLARSITATLTIIALLGWLAISSWLLAAALGVVVGLFTLVAFATRGLLDRSVREVRKRRGAISSFVSGRLGAVATIASMSRERTEYRKLADRIESMNQAAFRRAWIEGTLRGVAHAATAMLVITTLLVGRHEVQIGRLTAGSVVGTISLIGLFGAALRDLVRAMELWIPGRVARQRIQRILAEPVRNASMAASPTVPLSTSSLAIDGFTIDGLVEQANLEADTGDRILLEGPGGSGKSSFITALAGLIDPDAGHASFRGRLLCRLSPQQLRSTMGLASLMLPLLPGSIGMNLRYRVPKASVEEIAALLDVMCANEIVDARPNGLEHVLSDPNGELSLGQMQTLLLVRALLGAPPVLLLDSIDSHIAPDTMESLIALLSEYRGIVIFVATRPELRSIANRIWRIEGGRIVETAVSEELAGTREEARCS